MPLALTRLVFNAAAFGHRQRLQAVMVSQVLFPQVCLKLALDQEVDYFEISKQLVLTNLRFQSIPPIVSKCKLMEARILYRFPFKQFSNGFDRFSTSKSCFFELYGRYCDLSALSFAQSWPSLSRINSSRFIPSS